MEKELLEWAFSELYGDEDVPSAFDRLHRDEPPWFGFTPRIVACNLTHPFRPYFAYWKEGIIMETGGFAVDRRRTTGFNRAVLLLADRFADFCRERGLFGAYFVTGPADEERLHAGVAAALAREADWCGLFVLEPAPLPPGGRVAAAAALARRTAALLEEGRLPLPSQVARREGFYAARNFIVPLGNGLDINAGQATAAGRIPIE